MSLTNPKTVVTEERLSEFYQSILPYLGGIPDLLANKFSKGDLYSTDEQMVGQWIDGKPLYQKTYDMIVPNDFSANTDYTLPNTVPTGANMQSAFIDASASFIVYPSHGTRPPVFIYDNNVNNVWVSEYGIRLRSNGDINWLKGTRIVITLRYTKTTDSAIAIGFDTDYSTEEKIVGTWIDGSPVYQLTHIENSMITCPSETWTNTTLPVGNIGRIVHGEVFNNKNILNSFFISCTSSYVQLLNYRSKNTEITGFTIQYTKTT